ncbi:MAG TPA: nicotinamide riboside transporter PnuC [Chitinophagaceae bacterium]|nr:nicotinamide riboside transporter PnuC [Chitinophagaceae bacterium]
MTTEQILEKFIEGMRNTTWYEYIAVFTGLLSVWYSRAENILTYPVGIINTVIYIYISIKGSLFGEATVNLYYTIMSISGWIIWAKRNAQSEHIVHIKFSDQRWWMYQIIFFVSCYVTLFIGLTFLQNSFAPDAIPWADAFASAAAFTGMWLMTKKKVESWYFWLLTNISSIPLYFVKGYVFTSVYYFLLLIFAFWGLAAWRKKARAHA